MWYSMQQLISMFLMEDNQVEAVNNIFGTLNGRMSDKYRVSKFILISTDKAINLQMYEGHKRIAEIVIRQQISIVDRFATLGLEMCWE